MRTQHASIAPSFTLRVDPWGRLALTDADGREHIGVEVIRAFPISDPNHGVSVCDADGRELYWIEDVAALPDPTREHVVAGLAHREFTPVIERILRVTPGVEPAEWDVQTDRGRTRLRLKSDEDILRLSAHRAIVTDMNGVRYLIPDLRALDPATAKILERYL
jgi:PAS domain-containing protein